MRSDHLIGLFFSPITLFYLIIVANFWRNSLSSSTASPTYRQLSCRPANKGINSIIVRYEMMEPGRISCAAFEGMTSPVLKTVRSISSLSQSGLGNSAVHFSSGVWDMELGGLKGGISYQILCHTESFLNFPGVVTSTELSNVYKQSCNATVLSLKSTMLSITETENGSGATVVRGVVFNLMQVELSSLPSKKVTYTPIAFCRHL